MQTNIIEKAERVILSCTTRHQLTVAARYAERALRQAGSNGDEALLREAVLHKQRHMHPKIYSLAPGELIHAQ